MHRLLSWILIGAFTLSACASGAPPPVETDTDASVTSVTSVTSETVSLSPPNEKAQPKLGSFAPKMWLPGEDSNPHRLSQSQLSCRWTTGQ